ncbi:glycosyltransferase [Ornithinibacillus sp. L9]|uniref:Glycosyltransferase n=1 Tax=Ornithinibacillus caprae TaxID=2678566 RepID=A0A6N8FEN6_9BACI|nr:glycosyltransferase family 1 protein [Ornithinibacillus caprae]MUK87651.1 glycosyltransferase [Ornithinibacillus caprae]
MKIAIFTDTFYPDVNGVAKTLKRFTDYLRDQSIEYQVFAPKSSSGDMLTSHVHRFTSLPFFLYPECRIALPNVVHIKEEIQAFQPDIIHVATPFNMGLLGVHYAKKWNIPIVGSYHTDFDKYLDYYDFPGLKTVLWRYLRWFHRPLERIFVPSQVTLDHLKTQGFSGLSIWSRGVDCSQFHPNFDQSLIRERYAIKEKYILLYVGRLAPEKSVQLLPKVAEQLLNSISHDVHWLIVGDGPERMEIEKASPDHMTFTGFLSGEELARVYSAADLFVFPSATETFGNVVLESLASGTPVIAANAGGVRTIIKDGVTGVLCDPKSVPDFASQITTLLLDERKRKIMQLNSREYARSQSWDAIFEQLLFEYKEVIAERILVRAM